jgi:hypothetical protein
MPWAWANWALTLSFVTIPSASSHEKIDCGGQLGLEFDLRCPFGQRVLVERGAGLEAERDHITIVHFGQAQHVAEGELHGLEVLGKTRVVAKQIDGHDAVVCQAIGAGDVELGGVEHRAARGGVVEVALEHVERVVVFRVFDEVQRVHLEHGQALVQARQLEHRVADGDHRRVQFDRGDGGLGKLAVAELGHRGRAQAELDDGAWRLDEQHPGHHLLRVLEFRPVRLADAHGTLDPFGAEMQVAHALLFGQRDGRVLGFAGRAARRFGLFDGFAFDEHKTA